MTLREAYNAGKAELRKAGIEEADLDAWYLLEYITGVSRTVYFAEPGQIIEENQYREYMEYVRKRADHIPLQHLTGQQEFMGMTFCVNKDVLIPRQDTETLVETALKLIEKNCVPSEKGRLRLLDLCTGSGCILISILYHLQTKGFFDRPGSAVKKIQAAGADISAEAIAVARKNAASHRTEAEFIVGDLFENIAGTYDIILSNPPYIRTSEINRLQEEVRLHDPLCALDGRDDGLYFYRRIVDESRMHLEKKGILAFEIGYDQADDVSALMRRAGFVQIKCRKDLAGLDRVVYGTYEGTGLYTEKQ